VAYGVSQAAGKGRWLLARSLTPDEHRYVRLHGGISVKDNLLSVGEDTPVRLIAGQPGTYTPRDGYSLRIDVPCSALDQEGRCSLFGSPERPEMCSQWPDQPEQIADLNGCAYQTLFSTQEVQLSPVH